MSMYYAQLAAFLIAHHHAQWVTAVGDRLVFPGRAVLRIIAWAIRHGFTYQR